MFKRSISKKRALKVWKSFAIAMLLVPAAFGATYNKYGCTIQEIQTQPAINVGGTPHNIATVNLIQGSTTYVCWFLLDDAAGYGKILFSQLMAAQAANKKVDVEYSDLAPSPPIYTQDTPTTAATLNIWSVSTH